MNNNFGGVIWTNHALKRLKERNIKQGDAWATFNRPESSKKGKNGSSVYYKTYSTDKKGEWERIEVVAKKSEKGKWIILSVWSKKVYKKETKKPDSLLKLIISKIFNN